MRLCEGWRPRASTTRTAELSSEPQPGVQPVGTDSVLLLPGEGRLLCRTLSGGWRALATSSRGLLCGFSSEGCG